MMAAALSGLVDTLTDWRVMLAATLLLMVACGMLGWVLSSAARTRRLAMLVTAARADPPDRIRHRRRRKPPRRGRS